MNYIIVQCAWNISSFGDNTKQLFNDMYIGILRII